MPDDLGLTEDEPLDVPPGGGDEGGEPYGMEMARLAYELPRRDYERLEGRRDRFLGQLATTRTVTGAMATLFAGAIVIAGEPLSPALARTDVGISLAFTVALLALALISSIVPYYWPRWKHPLTSGDLLADEPGLGQAVLFWRLGQSTAAAVQQNAGAIVKLEAAANLAAALATLSALGLVASATLAVLALR